jgi:hypothetical protein
MRPKEEHWHLKSHNLWLKEGDRNTSFFHKQAKARLSRNNVKEIFLEDGSKISYFEDLKEAARQHFKNIFTQTK